MRAKLSWDEKVKRIATWRESGLSQAAYCHEADVDRVSFSRWVLRYDVELAGKRQGTAKTKIAVAPVQIVDDAPVSVTTQTLTPISSPPSYFILRGPQNWSLSLPSDTSPIWLGQLLQVLA